MASPFSSPVSSRTVSPAPPPSLNQLGHFRYHARTRSEIGNDNYTHDRRADTQTYEMGEAQQGAPESVNQLPDPRHPWVPRETPRYRYRSPQEIFNDSMLLQARARNEYFARVGMYNSIGPQPIMLDLGNRMRGFDMSTINGQAQHITSSLDDIARQRRVQREQTSLAHVPWLDFEIDAMANPPPVPPTSQRRLSV